MRWGSRESRPPHSPSSSRRWTPRPRRPGDPDPTLPDCGRLRPVGVGRDHDLAPKPQTRPGELCRVPGGQRGAVHRDPAAHLTAALTPAFRPFAEGAGAEDQPTTPAIAGKSFDMPHPHSCGQPFNASRLCSCLDCGTARAAENMASIARTVERWELEGEPERMLPRSAALVDGPPLGGGIHGLQPRSLYARTVY